MCIRDSRNIRVFQRIFRGLHPYAGEIIDGADAFLFLKGGGKISGVEMIVGGQHFHGKLLPVVLPEEGLGLFRDGFAHFRGPVEAGKGYFFFNQGEDFVLILIGSPEFPVGKTVPVFLGGKIIQPDEHFINILDQVFRIMYQGIKAVHQGADLPGGIFWAFAAKIILQALPVQISGQLRRIRG